MPWPSRAGSATKRVRLDSCTCLQPGLVGIVPQNEAIRLPPQTLVFGPGHQRGVHPLLNTYREPYDPDVRPGVGRVRSRKLMMGVVPDLPVACADDIGRGNGHRNSKSVNPMPLCLNLAGHDWHRLQGHDLGLGHLQVRGPHPRASGVPVPHTVCFDPAADRCALQSFNFIKFRPECGSK